MHYEFFRTVPYFSQKNKRGDIMQNMQHNFLAHVSINQRIYEISLENNGQESELLRINNVAFPEFSNISVDEILNKRSIMIENHLVHFYQINEVLSVELESPEMNKSTVEEKLAAPCFPLISQIMDNDSYYDEPEKKEEERKNYMALFFYGVIICFAFLYNPPLGMYTGIVICVILDFLHEIYKQYQLAKQFPKDKDRWL